MIRLLACLALGCSVSAQACQPLYASVKPPSLKEVTQTQFNNAEAVFVGRVAIVKRERIAGDVIVTAILEPERVYKGNPASFRVFRSSALHMECDFATYPVVGRKYVYFGFTGTHEALFSNIVLLKKDTSEERSGTAAILRILDNLRVSQGK